MFSSLRQIIRLAFIVLTLSTLHATAMPSVSVALHYSERAPLEDLKLFDIVVVESDHGYNPVSHRSKGSELYAYASVAEVQSTRSYFKDIPPPWQLARNGQWNSVVIDQTPAEWPTFFADRVIGPLWKQGYRGFFLDTLDSYRLSSRFDETAQQDGLVRLIEGLHQRFPGIKLILNRGFEVIPRLQGKVEMVAAESLYRGWNAGSKRYEEVPESDRQWLMAQLKTIQERDRIPVLAIDYVPPHDRTLARETATKIQQNGFIPWVSDSDLSTVGVGGVELMPRRVLMIYNGAESATLNYSVAHRFLQMPLNHMGYVVDYADVRDPLPKAIYRDRYAGVVTSFAGYIPTAKHTDFSRWLHSQMAAGMPVAVIGDFGLQPDRSWTVATGIQAQGGAVQGALRVTQTHAMMGYEVNAPQVDKDYSPLRISKNIGQVVPLIEFKDQKGQEFVAGALTPWGGFITDPYVLADIPGTDQNRWIVDPFAFLSQALKLSPLPVPDITTENGRRLLLAHIDGDGFPSKAEFAGSPFAAEVLLKQILEKYRIPHTVAIIEGETAPHGLYPKISAQLEDIAKRMYRLPHVELASHSFSHPFLWNTDVKHGVFTENSEAEYHMDIPGYQMDLHREISGSTDYIRRRLAPSGKDVKVFQWTGDTAPSASALKIAYEAGLVNINGGDTFISKMNPTLTAVRAHGITKDGYLQVYAPITNENIYTNLWRGPFYGFERVIETFQMTDSPRRIKPVGIYYHTYSASKQASLRALRKAYDWALDQPLHPVYTSEYIQKVQDFHNIALGRENGGWRVRGSGHLRTLRLPSAMGAMVATGHAGIAGSREGQEGTYVHLTGGKAWFQSASSSATSSGTRTQASKVSLREANARIASWTVSPDGLTTDMTLQGHVPLQWSMVGMNDNCQLRANKRLTPAQKSQEPERSDLRNYRLPDASAHIQITCAAR